MSSNSNNVIRIYNYLQIITMEKLKGYNRNLMGGKRRHKKIQRYGQYKTLAERLVAEAKGLQDYLNRVNKK